MQLVEQDVDWVELGCRGWDINHIGAGLYGASDEQPLGDPTVSLNDYAHIDQHTLALMMDGSPAFVRRVVDDLEAAGYPGLVKAWMTIAYPYANTTGTTVADPMIVSVF